MDPNRLKSIPLFQDVEDEELAQIAPFAEEESVEEGTYLVKEGDFSYEFMAIEEGKAEVLRDGEHVADLGPGDFFGELSVIDQMPRLASVIAEDPTNCLGLASWDLIAEIERDPKLALNLLRALALRLRAAREEHRH